MTSPSRPYHDPADLDPGLDLGLLKRLGVLAFGAFAYAAFLASFLYLLGFLTDRLVPITIDHGRDAPGILPALAIDLALVTAFAMQHSVMARSGFKAWLARHASPTVERSVYVLASSAVLALLCGLWQPVPQMLWQLEAPLLVAAAWGAFGLGVVTVLVSTFLIDHFDLFGLKQSWAAFMRRRFQEPAFVTPWLYRHVRHPLYVGWILTFFATPTMSVGHLWFAATMTLYILIAIRFEERDLVRRHGAAYLEYRERVPMLVPRLGAARA